MAELIADPYDPRVNAETFDFSGWLAEQNPRLLGTAEGRRLVTRLDPMLFALTYLPHHLKNEETGGAITWADAHLQWFQDARRWAVPSREPAEHRDAYVAPRSTGKSTFFFLLLPLWAGAHGWRKFVAAFADSATQAQTHLATLKRELEVNELLRHDFPELCEPAKRLRGVTVSDNVGMLHAASGFVFAARGIDSGSLGMKVGNLRPDLLLMDDVEPDESNYSEGQVKKRLTTLRDTILPLNVFARVVLVGTVTMPGSIVHQLVQHGRGEQTHEWVDEERFRVHHALPILTREDGSERSVWPGKWTMDFLNAIRRTRSFAKNYLNAPLAEDGAYWVEEDLKVVNEPEDGYAGSVLSIDPATTSKTTSDFYGLAVVGRSTEPEVSLGTMNLHHRAYVRHAEKVRMAPAALRLKVGELLERFEDVGLILVETNQGGEVWEELLHGLPVKVKTIHQSEKKEVRAQRALNFYQRGQVVHTRHLPALDEELLVFPHGMNDDLVDAVGTAVNTLLVPRKKKPKATASSRFAA